MGLIIFVKEDVLRFYISMNYSRTAVMVKVSKALSCTERNPEASFPVKFFLLG
jgi:hypothetical protein